MMSVVTEVSREKPTEKIIQILGSPVKNVRWQQQENQAWGSGMCAAEVECRCGRCVASWEEGSDLKGKDH